MSRVKMGKEKRRLLSAHRLLNKSRELEVFYFEEFETGEAEVPPEEATHLA